MHKNLLPLITMTFAVGLMGAKGGCQAINSTTPAPSMNGVWAIQYDDDLQVEITIGGAAYERTLGAGGGAFTIDHNGQPLTFDLSCERPEVICPSEAWPTRVSADHREPRFPNRFWMTLPGQTCSGRLVRPDPAQCGTGTNNPDCEQVCEGEVSVTETDHFGLVNEAGTGFDLFLGAGVASNGINCALLGVSSAHADLVSTGSGETGNWEAVKMTGGEVVAGYAGGCLWAGDINGDAQLEALILGAQVVLRTGFTGTKR